MKQAIYVLGISVSAIALGGEARAGELMAYSYDALGRLTATNIIGGPSGGVALGTVYDPAGNRQNYTVVGSSGSASVTSPAPKRPGPGTGRRRALAARSPSTWRRGRARPISWERVAGHAWPATGGLADRPGPLRRSGEPRAFPLLAASGGKLAAQRRDAAPGPAPSPRMRERQEWRETDKWRSAPHSCPDSGSARLCLPCGPWRRHAGAGAAGTAAAARLLCRRRTGRPVARHLPLQQHRHHHWRRRERPGPSPPQRRAQRGQH